MRRYLLCASRSVRAAGVMVLRRAGGVWETCELGFRYGSVDTLGGVFGGDWDDNAFIRELKSAASGCFSKSSFRRMAERRSCGMADKDNDELNRVKVRVWDTGDEVEQACCFLDLLFLINDESILPANGGAEQERVG